MSIETLYESIQVQDADGTILLRGDARDTDRYVITSLDPGMPEIREVADPWTFRSGTNDVTALSGARAVSMTLKPLTRTARYQLLETLGKLAQPARRPYLHLEVPVWDGGPWRLQLRASQFSAPLDYGAELQAGWKAPDGFWESVTEYERPIPTSGTETDVLTLPFTLPITLGAGTPASALIVNVGGFEETRPVLDIYGSAPGPIITNQTTGQQIAFSPSYTVPVGEFVRVDCTTSPPSVHANGDDGPTRLSELDWSKRQGLRLVPGQNLLTLALSAAGNTDTQAIVRYHERRR